MLLGDVITPEHLLPLIGTDAAPLIVDVRREPTFATSGHVLPAARRAPHDDLARLMPETAGQPLVVYCVHGHNVSQQAAASLRAAGIHAAWLQGGIEGWKAAGGPVVARAPDEAGRFGGGTTWVTRRRPKIDRVACSWLIRRFVDARARFLFVENEHVLPIAAESGAISLDVEGAEVTHDGAKCSFDALLDRYEISDIHMRQLADIVRAADTGALSEAPEAAGLLAISLGYSVLERDDHAMVTRGCHLYDGLYAFLRHAPGEKHGWPPARTLPDQTKALA
jgi:rhodanese-related sulfurtransferase